MEPNFVMTGDEARFIINAIIAEGTTYNGPSLPAITNLLIRLQNINVNQPPKEKDEPDGE
jgi:hypothetical protein